MNNDVKLSVVIPFLNEEKSIGRCVRKVQGVFKKNGINGEIICVDSDSSDNSAKIAKSLGAIVVNQPLKGYGNALKKGFETAIGDIIVMGDADDTYDFEEIPKLINPIIRNKYDIVNGNRFDGKLMPGSMSISHILGNKILNLFVTVFFGKFSSDPYSGFKAITKSALNKMDLKSSTWEWNSELILKGKSSNLRIMEVPVHYYPREGESKLSGIDAAWKNIKFMLSNSPKHVFFIPGISLMAIGSLFFALLYFEGISIGTIKLSYLSILLSAILIIFGFQIYSLGLIGLFFINRNAKKSRIKHLLKLENSLILGLCLFVIGVLIGGYIFLEWLGTGFADIGLNKLGSGMFSFILMSIGIQIIYSSLLMIMIRVDN